MGEVETNSVFAELLPRRRRRRRQKRFEQSTARSVDEESMSDNRKDSQKRPVSKQPFTNLEEVQVSSKDACSFLSSV
jgi:hypothetical protein